MKTLKTVLILITFFFFASWLYKLLAILFLAVVWRDKIKQLHKWVYPSIITILLVAIFMVIPRFRYNTSDRVRLIYQDKTGNAIHPPISHYIANMIIPEEEAMNVCIYGVRCAGMFPSLANWLVQDFLKDDKKGNIANFYSPFDALNWSGNFPMSGVTSQVFYQMGLGSTQSVYLIKPKNYNPEKSYPVVFFMHGLMGNWKLYQGIFKDLDDCIVLSIGTKDWSGIYQKSDINALFTKQIPFLKNMGFKVDENNLHLIGLSNGGSASNVAYNSFSNKFKTITFISTGINQTYPVESKILLIGGGGDPSSSSLKPAYTKLKENGSKAELYWQNDETHYLLVNKKDEIISLLNSNYQ